MTEMALLYRPGDLPVVAHATVLPIDDFSHIDLIRPGTHFKSKLMMAHFAAKTDTMKPVREDYWAHIIGLGKPV
jgi:hypothetical protein